MLFLTPKKFKVPALYKESYGVFFPEEQKIWINFSKMKKDLGDDWIVEATITWIHEFVHLLQWKLFGSCGWDLIKLYQREIQAYSVEYFFAFFLRSQHGSIEEAATSSLRTIITDLLEEHRKAGTV